MPNTPLLILFSDDDTHFERNVGSPPKETKATASPIDQSEGFGIPSSIKLINTGMAELEFLTSFFDANCNVAAAQSTDPISKVAGFDDKKEDEAAAAVPVIVLTPVNMPVQNKPNGDSAPTTPKLAPPKIKMRKKRTKRNFVSLT